MHRSRRLWVPALLLALTALAPAASRADGNEWLGSSYVATLRGGGIVSEGVGLATRLGGPGSGSIAIAGIPAGATVVKALLYWGVIGGDDDTLLFAGSPVTGTLAGRSENSGWAGFNPPLSADNRVYRADVTATVAGNGSYAVSGAGDTGEPGVDGQGASLVVVYERPSASYDAMIVVNDGAITVGCTRNFPADELVSQAFGFFAPHAPVAATLHVGFGDGEPATAPPFETGTEREIMVGPYEVAPPNSVSGSDGSMWDDLSFAAPAAAFNAGSNSTSNTIQFATDCLLWAYAALELRLPDQPILITAPSPGAILSTSSVQIAGTAADGTASVRLSNGAGVIGEAPVSGGTWSHTSSFADGPATVTATGLDAGGSPIGLPSSVSFTVDTVAPSVEITHPGTLFPPVIGRLEIEGTASDGGSVVSVEVRIEALPVGGSRTVQATCYSCGTGFTNWYVDAGDALPGVYRLTARAFDAAGNAASSTTVVALKLSPR